MRSVALWLCCNMEVWSHMLLSHYISILAKTAKKGSPPGFTSVINFWCLLMLDYWYCTVMAQAVTHSIYWYQQQHCLLEVKQRRARLVLGWVTARVLDHEACPTHWTGCQVGQVVRLLGLGSMVATVSCWPLPSGMSFGLMVLTWQRGFSPGTQVSSPN